MYAGPDLAEAMARISRLVGVEPSPGGKHPHGTHNALLSLGEGCYLEIIAPDPSQPAPDRPRSFGLDTRKAYGLVTWAVAAPNMDHVIAAARSKGYDPGVVIQGARARPDGVELRWRSTKRPEALDGWPPPGDGLVPFLIEWGPNTPHPSITSAQGCTLVAVEAAHPDPALVQHMLDALGVDLQVAHGPAPRLRAILDTPRGRVVLE